MLDRPPRGYVKDHPLIDDLKCKDFVAIAPFDDICVTSKRFRSIVRDHFSQATPYMRFLCKALELPFQ